MGAKPKSGAGKAMALQGARQSNGRCACDAHETRKAVAVDPEIKAANRHRLRRIEGQIRGLQIKRRTVTACGESKGKFAGCKRWWKRTATARTSSRKSPAFRKRCEA